MRGTAAALVSATGTLRREVGRQTGVRLTPTLEFIADAVPENARVIEDLLSEARGRDAELEQAKAGATYAGESRPLPQAARGGVGRRGECAVRIHGRRTRPRAGVTSAPHGILLVDKAPERTSHDVVARVRWLLGTKKVGHAGTLDPMATGLLVLGVGQGTRLLTYLVGLDKTYQARIRLGRATTTDDREGEPLGDVVDATGLMDQELEHSLSALRGDIEQVPSTVSAIKIDGKRAYARARAGEDVELAARPVQVSRFAVTGRSAEGPFLDLDAVIDCSSGTYVRALARDLGSAHAVGGHLTALRRTAVGPFSVEDALHVPARGEGDDVDLPLQGLGAIAARVLPVLPVDEEQATALGTGRRIRSEVDVVPAPASLARRDPPGPPGRRARRLRAPDRDPGPRGSSWRPLLVVPVEARC